MHRDIGRKFLGKFIEFLYFKIRRFTGDFLFVQSKDLIGTHHLLILTLMNAREDKMTYHLLFKFCAFLYFFE